MADRNAAYGIILSVFFTCIMGLLYVLALVFSIQARTHFVSGNVFTHSLAWHRPVSLPYPRIAVACSTCLPLCVLKFHTATLDATLCERPGLCCEREWLTCRALYTVQSCGWWWCFPWRNIIKSDSRTKGGSTAAT